MHHLPQVRLIIVNESHKMYISSTLKCEIYSMFKKFLERVLVYFETKFCIVSICNVFLSKLADTTKSMMITKQLTYPLIKNEAVIMENRMLGFISIDSILHNTLAVSLCRYCENSIFNRI